MKRIEKIISEIQKIPENDFSKNFLIPTLEKAGFYRVEFYGGTDEEGKDILLWEKDPLGKLTLSVAQVKHFPFSNKASGHSSFQTVVNQLIACKVKEVCYSDKSVHFPSKLYLISTFPINSKNIKSRFSNYGKLLDHNVEIIDCYKIIELIEDHHPKLISKILNEKFNLQYINEGYLNNNKLLNALHSITQNKSINKFYTSIDISVGSETSKIFYNNQISYKDDKIEFSEDQFDTFLQVYKQLNQQESSLVFSEKNYSLINDILNEKKETNELIKKSEIILLQKKLRNNKFAKSYLKLPEHGKTKIVLNYTVKIDTKAIVSNLTGRRNKLLQQFREIKMNKFSIDELSLFVQETQSTLNTIEKIFKIPSISNSLEFIKLHNNQEGDFILDIPLSKLFDTNNDFILLGEAGAGKTTSLQYYALNFVNKTDKIIFWAPLSQVIQQSNSLNHELSTLEKTRSFDKLLYEYLKSTNTIDIFEELEFILQSDKFKTILLDGFDEAITNQEWLILAIDHFKRKYNNIQLIISCRPSNKLINDLKFFSLTLLPFTNNQRDQFIENWFDDKKSPAISKIKEHLSFHPNIAEITKNPLLITALCVLTKHDLPLPATEIKLYDNRVKLLTGYYDRVKDIKTRIFTDQDDLIFITKKIAYFLHLRNVRELPKDELYKLAYQVCNSRLNQQNSIKAIDELIDPCNILVPMQKLGNYGLGHLRFQEHLAGSELVQNRSANIMRFIGDNWWTQPLFFFAQIVDDLTWLIINIGPEILYHESRNVIMHMINLRPEGEILKIKSIIQRFEDGIL